METTDANPLESLLHNINDGVVWFGSMSPVIGGWAGVALSVMFAIGVMMVVHTHLKRYPGPVEGVMRHRRRRWYR